MNEVVDIKANRAARKWAPREQAIRVLWALARPAFCFSPRIFWAWRTGLLRLFGASIGRGVHVYPTVRILIPWHVEIGDYATVGDRVILYALGRITIGDRATISQGAHLCAGTHDYRRADFLLLKQPISIGEGAWICSDAFVGPGVDVGAYAIVGARAVVMRNVEGWDIVAGNPAKIVKKRPRPRPA